MHATSVRLSIIGNGGFIGSVIRFLMSGFIQKVSDLVSFPIGTLVENLIGCFVFGFLLQIAVSHNLFNGEAGMVIFVEVLGGFTTFSTFSNESFNLLQAGENTFATLSLIAHIVFGLGAIWMGRLFALANWKLATNPHKKIINLSELDLLRGFHQKVDMIDLRTQGRNPEFKRKYLAGGERFVGFPSVETNHFPSTIVG